MTDRIWKQVFFDPVDPAEIVDAAMSDAEQRAVIECSGTGPCLVIAGPGTGKSHSLVERLRHHVRRPSSTGVAGCPEDQMPTSRTKREGPWRSSAQHQHAS